MSLAYAQLSLVSVWAVLEHRSIGWRLLVPFGGGLACALVSEIAEHGSGSGEEMVAFIGLYWLHILAALAVLWVIGPTRIGRGTSIAGGAAWRFSIKNLLELTTALAILLALFVPNRLLGGVWGSVAMLVATNMALLVAALAVRRASIFWPFGLGVNLVVATLIGFACEATDTLFADGLYFIPYSLIQSFLMWCWLEVRQARSLNIELPVGETSPPFPRGPVM